MPHLPFDSAPEASAEVPAPPGLFASVRAVRAGGGKATWAAVLGAEHSRYAGDQVPAQGAKCCPI